MTEPLRFCFDFVSPYAYLAWSEIHDLAARHRRIVEPVPVLFAALLDRFGHKGPAEIAPKRMYMFKNALRLAGERGIALSPPPAHPFNPLLALRLAGLEQPAEQRRRVIDVLYAAVWGGGPGVTDPGVVARILTDAGFDGDRLVARAGQPEAKARLRAATDAAIESGVFGVPTAIVDGELFWGLDAHPHIDAFLAGDDCISPELVTRWRDLPAQSRRPGG